MKVLLLTNGDSEDIYGEFYTGLHKQIGSMDMRRLGQSEQQNLKSYFQHHIELSKYDRVIIDLNFDIIVSQLRFFRQLENLVFFDSTACFDNMPDTPHYQQHSKFYKKMPWVRVIVTSYQTMKHFQQQDIDAWCVPEGYNTQKYTGSSKKRDIDLILINNKYTESSPPRNEFIAALKTHYPEVVIEDNIDGNINRLNRSRIAICADMGAGEYSGTVFAAMASGCMVMCYDQGCDESRDIGLRDMENIVLFKYFEDFCDKITYLKQHPEMINKIAESGHAFAVANHQQPALGQQAAKYIGASMRKMKDYQVGISAFGWRF
ncbi:MAG: hypothetical protein CR977_00925 [Gammaproteobacteria bacterium]|nr:MAG: hypothetical protein CR977_00925 [Gammaproteobacteria bacterium]